MAGSLPILTFHAVDDRASVISFPVNLFKRGMASLHGNAYRTLNLTGIIDHLQHGIPFPAQSFVITFDDGYQSVYEEAFPILQSYGFSAIVFLTTGSRGHQTDALRLPSMCGRSMLSWSEIREMQRCGIEFGAHTLTHPDLTRLSIKSAEREICESKAIIENALSTSVASFAYPYGRYDTRSREIVRRHFTCASSDKLGLAHTGSDVFALERVDAYYLRSRRLFDLISTAFFPWYIYGRNLPRQIRRAGQFWQSRSNSY
jgi:peptidoglycan/xylan/chitin deacetylase (PgdA/CDA1 family)